MGSLPVISHCFRVEFPFDNGLGSTAANILHFTCADTSNVNDIVDKLRTATGGISDPLWKAMSSNYSASNVFITPLDGVTAGSDVGWTGGIGGGSTGDAIPNLALVMSWHTGHRGSEGRGRTFIGPITEGIQTGGIIDTAILTAAATSWGDWHANMQTGTPSVVPVVASYKHAVARPIVSIRADRKAGSMRRRLERVHS
jgi:hypothetical protein